MLQQVEVLQPESRISLMSKRLVKEMRKDMSIDMVSRILALKDEFKKFFLQRNKMYKLEEPSFLVIPSHYGRLSKLQKKLNWTVYLKLCMKIIGKYSATPNQIILDCFIQVV
jgi:hypothetical protein